MSWRGESGGIEAAKQKHDVIMTPNTYLYFDYYQAKDCLLYTSIPSGPLFRGANVRGGKVFLSFDYGEGMRSSDGKPLQCFEVAEYDGIYYPATAEVVRCV